MIRTMKVNVTQKDIDLGVQRLSTKCIVQKGIEDWGRVKGVRLLRVTACQQTIRFTDKEQRLRFYYMTPPHVALIIAAYDHGIIPKPFSFVLRRDRAVQIIPVMSGQGKKQKAWRRAKAITEMATHKTHPAKGKRFATPNASPAIYGGSPPPLLPGSASRVFGVRGLNRAFVEHLLNLPKTTTKKGKK